VKMLPDSGKKLKNRIFRFTLKNTNPFPESGSRKRF
jgi:hypothetical protein